MTNLHPIPKAQRGTTLIGFVVGLLVGLAVALSVAIYVTRVPVPLVDRGLTRSPEQDTEEARRNQGWNPNAVLGTAPAPSTPPSPASTPEAAPAAPTAPAPTTPASPPASQTAAAAPTPAPAPAAKTEDPFIYFVQAGAFRSDEDAQAQRAKLAMLGIEAQVSEREQSGRTVFRVRVGPFKQKIQAETLRDQLQGQSIEAALVRVQP